MANKRFLKKQIAAVSGLLLSEVLINLYMEETKEGKDYEKIAARILAMNSEFIRRAHRPAGNGNTLLVKQYYQKLRKDLQAEINSIIDEITALSEQKGE